MQQPYKNGDIGYIIYRHGVIYAIENQLDETFEAYVAKYMAEFLENYDSTKEKLWSPPVLGQAVQDKWAQVVRKIMRDISEQGT